MSLQQFSQEWLFRFFWFLAQWKVIQILKNWQSALFQEKNFWLQFGQKGPEWPFWIISQTHPKYQKQSVYNIFTISQEKHEGWSWFFACWQMLKVFSNWYYHFRCVWPGMSKLPKITSLLFLYKMLRKKWVMQLMLYMQISLKDCYKLILRFFDGYGQAFPKFSKKHVCNVFAISLKKLEMKLTFLMQINIKVS